MQSEKCGNRTGIDPAQAHRYGLFQLAARLPAPAWRNGLSLAFPASDVEALDGATITPACIGLLGMAGTLPYSYTEAVARDRGGAARAFLDLLAAPAIGIFCAAWRDARPEHAPLPALPGPRGTLRARALAEHLARLLGIAVHIEQFAARWERLPPGQCTALGGTNAYCGAGALLGERLLRMDIAVRIVIGPLDRYAAQAFMPGGAGARSLRQAWSELAGSAGGVGAEACIRLQAGAACGATLGAGARIGHDAYVLAGPATCERDDLRYRLC